MLSRKVHLIFFLTLSLTNFLFADEKGYARQEGDIFNIGNNKIEREFRWNNGNLITTKIIDKMHGKVWESGAKQADFFVPGQSDNNMKPGKWDIKRIETPASDPYSEVTVEYALEGLSIRRVFRIYDDCPAIGIDTYLKGKAKNSWIVQNKDLGNWRYLPQRSILSQWEEIPILDQISIRGKHWKLDAIEFTDNSDSHNTFVKPHSETTYAENVYKGNILFLANLEEELGIFYLKESPLAPSQLAYPGADFVVKFGEVKTIGIGITASDLQGDEWIKTYSIVFGVSANDELSQLKALHNYHKNKTPKVEMISMNTWGDRGSLERLTEEFCFKQIEACAQLGISHFQLDWGWQEYADYIDKDGIPIKKWTPKRSLFPNGFEKVVAKGKEEGVEVCLYFVPNTKYDNEGWERDADDIIHIYKEYGVRIFKIDGQMMQSKAGEVRTRKMYEKVMRETDHAVIFNYDITAGQRGGYFFLNDRGNLFIENRYTDFTSYYPYKTLRNIWMLSKYVSAEKIQVEFLNKWRNQEKYGEDIFAPAHYSMDYLFAITMAGQPLAFMDVADLPGQAFESPNLIKTYKSIQHDFHQGVILPVGDEPSGKSWTGFQSIHGNRGFLLILREYNPNDRVEIATWLPKGVKIELTPILGEGKKNKQTTGNNGNISLQLAKENSFVLYKYTILN